MSDEWSDESYGALSTHMWKCSEWVEATNTSSRNVTTKYCQTSMGGQSAFERRMMNISFVFSLMGREWLTGLLPAKNVGTNVAVRIEKFIADAEGRKFAPVVELEMNVQKAAKEKKLPEPKGNQSPGSSVIQVTQFKLDAAVKAWVLQHAKGACEACSEPAPFSRADGVAFLETHHVRQLADGGTDTITNTVALCPNCHREIHYGVDGKKLIAQLLAGIGRLVPE